MSRKSLLYLFFSLLVLVSLSGCGETAAAHKVKLPNGIESKLPMPKKAIIALDTESDGMQLIVFHPGIKFKQAEKFFKKNFKSKKWKQAHEELADKKKGERTSWWIYEGHGVTAHLSLAAEGGKNTKDITGTYVIEYDE